MKLLMLFISCVTFNSYAQDSEQQESSVADCIGAVEVTNYNESNVQLPGNSGKVLDLEKSLPDFFETNAVWLRLEPNLVGAFGFSISTESNIDFNYYLYKDSTGNSCNDIYSGKLLPIRSDSLSLLAKGLNVKDSNRTSSFSKNAVQTKLLDVYYLLIHSNSTYQADIKIKYFREGQIGELDAYTQNFTTNPRYKTLSIRVRDVETGEAIQANVAVKGIHIDDKLFQGTDFMFDARPSKNVEITVNAKGYFLEVKNQRIRTSEDSEIIVAVEKLAAGKKLRMEGIRFQQDSKEFIPVSKIALKRLLDFMVVNFDTKIEIQGHVNAPGYGAKKHLIKISEARAKEVYKYLIENGISKNRLTFKGCGNTQMIYPNPANLEQEDANRRVEIMIIE